MMAVPFVRLAMAACLASVGLHAPIAHAAADDVSSALAELQYQDARLQSAGWRLVTANAPYCANAAPRIGLLLQDMMNYDDPGDVRAAAGIRGDIAVQAVAEGSPAALAGLRANMEVIAIDGKPAMSRAARPGDYQRLLALHRDLDASLARDGRVTLTLHDKSGERDVTLEGVAACPSRFEVMAGGGAQADGERVQIGFRFAGGDRPTAGITEDQYAAIVSHELAHNLLGHTELLNRIGRAWPKVRRTEREADRLSVWLLANAGYDPGAAPSLRAYRGKNDFLGFLREPTHDGWRTRVSDMEQEVARVRKVLVGYGKADWSRHFEREPGVDLHEETPDASN